MPGTVTFEGRGEAQNERVDEALLLLGRRRVRRAGRGRAAARRARRARRVGPERRGRRDRGREGVRARLAVRAIVATAPRITLKSPPAVLALAAAAGTGIGGGGGATAAGAAKVGGTRRCVHSSRESVSRESSA